MSDIARALGLETYSLMGEWRALFRLRPSHRREFVYGFLLRLIVGLVAVAVSSVCLMLVGALNGWHLTRGLLVLYGLFISAMVLIGEHVRSRVYERFVVVEPSTAAAKTDPAQSQFESITAEYQRGRFVRALSPVEAWLKRVFDILFASIALGLLFPVLIVIATAIKFDSPGPVLFRQQRKGFDGRSFSMLKFRTMSVLEDGRSVLSVQADLDPRITEVGRYLRRTSMDELPQLFNVLIGNMSLVGPRIAHDNRFEEVLENYALRRNMKPGLTGWAQIHGLRGPTPTLEHMQRRLEYDLWYIHNWSLWLDIRIVLETPIEVLRGRRAS